MAYARGDSRAPGAAPMTPTARDGVADHSTRALKAAAISWFVVAVLGQLMFVAYVLGFYGRAAARGRFETWNKVLPHGYVPGDRVGNMMVSLHLLFATVVIFGGALQLIPVVRRLAPAFHRWNGRVYLLSAGMASVAGLLMVWVRGSSGGDLSQHLAISLNAVLILVFAGLVCHHARARRIDVHRRWAIRLFLAVSGVWFFRIGLMFWIVVNQGPVGFDPKTFQGPFLTFLSFADFLLPLAVLQLYFHAQGSKVPARRLAVAAGLFALTLMTGGGIAAASLILWLPRL